MIITNKRKNIKTKQMKCKIHNSTVESILYWPATPEIRPTLECG